MQGTLFGLINAFNTFFGRVIIALVGIALLGFLWSLLRLIMNPDNEEIRSETKKVVAFGVVALFAMVALWGLVQLVTTVVFSGSPITNIPVK